MDEEYKETLCLFWGDVQKIKMSLIAFSEQGYKLKMVKIFLRQAGHPARRKRRRKQEEEGVLPVTKANCEAAQ